MIINWSEHKDQKYSKLQNIVEILKKELLW